MRTKWKTQKNATIFKTPKILKKNFSFSYYYLIIISYYNIYNTTKMKRYQEDKAQNPLINANNENYQKKKIKIYNLIYNLKSKMKTRKRLDKLNKLCLKKEKGEDQKNQKL